MIVAGLDFGTNTFLCLIAEVENQAIKHIIEDEVRVVRLGQDVNQTKKFHAEALARADQAMQDFSDLLIKYKPEKILAMATSAARDVTNSEELFKIAKKHQIPLQIIPGEKEAELTYSGSVSGLSNESATRLVVDVGGGSTEFIVGRGQKLDKGQSLNIGCVRLTETFQLTNPCPADKRTQAQLYIQKALSSLNLPIEIDEILAVAGTPTEIAKIELGGFDRLKIDGYIITKKRLEHWLKVFSEESKEKIISQYGVHPGRADVILVGVLILLETLQHFKKEHLTVSTRGVRFGVALEIAK